MPITSETITGIWERGGNIHVAVEDLRHYLRLIQTEGNFTPDEEHLLSGLLVKLDEVDEIGNQISRFIMDYVNDHNIKGGADA